MCKSCGVPLFNWERSLGECQPCVLRQVEQKETLAKAGRLWTGRPQWALDRVAAWDYTAGRLGLNVEHFRE